MKNVETYCIYDFKGQVEFAFICGIYLVDPLHIDSFKGLHSKAIEISGPVNKAAV